MKRFVYLSLCLFLVLGASLAAAERPATKQLAGPIDEIHSGVMAPVDPAESGIYSKSAMIPVDLVQSKSGAWQWHGTVPVDHEQFSMMLFSGEESWSLNVRRADTKSAVPAHELAARVKRASLGMGNTSFEGDFYEFEGVEPGDWTISVEAGAPLTGRGYLLVSSDSNYRAVSYRTGDDPLVGNRITFVGYGVEEVAEGVREKSRAGGVEDAHLRVTAPNGKVFERAMSARADGVFRGAFRADQEGTYTVQVVTRGMTGDGHAFLRTAEHLVPVVAPQVELTLDRAAARVVDENRLAVSLPVYNAAGGPDHYRVLAEVWGADANGEMQAVNWIGGMVYVEDGELNLGLDLRWIGMSAARSGFELRNVRIEDPDTFVAVARTERMVIDMPELPSLDRFAPKAIDVEMLMGPQPKRMAAKGTGSYLMLVHGYCSGDAWGPVWSHFSGNRLKFQDFNKNRSHDYFAQLIDAFGDANAYSFGIVAHSQGGAAALHLYTYYWSGLDNASGSRLIQSVGTPYQGTALAGNAAVLGQIFGAGCGSNYDLTYSGASSWLSGIPSWARDNVNYYTTSFTDRWWAYDYCHLATDLLLSDPEDGTTEKSKGQLSYGVNRGHKTGWCHTTGMRDPAQVTDSSRNSTMNAYAAR